LDAGLQETTMQTGYDRSIFLSTMPATRRDRTAALAVVGVSAVLFACSVPFAGTPLAPVPAFVASYQSALAINDLILWYPGSDVAFATIYTIAAIVSGALIAGVGSWAIVRGLAKTGALSRFASGRA
jgi:ABC-type thiamin/hydroxymethylpyrimidine transport system permease subunit